MMDLYEQVHSQLFKDGTCKLNTWHPVHLVHDGGRELDCLAVYPSKGMIKLAVKAVRGHERGKYLAFRFNRKHELVEDGIWYTLNGFELNA